MGPVWAQQGGTKEELEKGKIGKYERKSISYFQTYYQVSMDRKHQEVIERGIRGAVEQGRFDYNAIPIDVDNINDLAQVIARYVDQVKLDRAKAQAREDYRFKEKLVTGADLERIINSAYIYIPILTKYKEGKIVTWTGTCLGVTVGAQVTFYHIKPLYVNGQLDDVQIAVLKTIVAESSKCQSEAKVVVNGKVIRGEPENRWNAFESAVNGPFTGLARKIQVTLRKIPEFQLAAQVQSSGSNSITFEFGRQSDVELDAGYKVYEEMASKGKNYIGYVKVRKVGDEKAKPPVSSRAQKIIQKEKIEAGTEIKEYPQLLLNGYLRGGIMPIDQSQLASGASSIAPALLGGFEYDLARFIGISELWGNVEGHFAFGSKASNLGVEGGLVKKFYIRRLALDLGVRGGLDLIGRDPVQNESHDYSYYQDQFGLTGFGGLELLLTPWLSFTGQAGYRIYNHPDTWVMEKKEKENNDTENPGTINGPVVNTSGPAITFGITGMF